MKYALLLIGAVMAQAEPDPVPVERCTPKQEDDESNFGRVQECSSMFDCYDKVEKKFKNSNCNNKLESCG